MENAATNKPGRQSSLWFGWTARDWAVVLICGVVFGLIYRLWDDLYTVMLVEWGWNLAPTSLINGMWFMGGFVPAAITRKPGACLFGESLAALVEVTVGPYTIDVGDFGPEIYRTVYIAGQGYPVFNMVLYVGILEGLAPEYVLGWFGYRRWDWTAWVLAGAAGGLIEFCTGIWMTHYYVFESTWTFWGLLLTSLIGVGVIGGSVAWLVGRVVWRGKEERI